jgi:uracil-DNA glycosylase
MMAEYFPLAGLERGQNVSICNTIKCRWRGTNELPPLGRKEKLAEQAVKHCMQAHWRRPEGTKLLVAQGEYALYGLTGQRSISKWRGWLLPSDGSTEYLTQVWKPRPTDIPVLATMHLAALYHDLEEGETYPGRALARALTGDRDQASNGLAATVGI